MSRSLQIPQYTTGTIAIGALSGGYWPLTGAGTNFLSPDGVTNWTVAVGDIVIVPGVGMGTVGVVNSATSLSLDYWSGSTVTAGAAYKINRLTGIPSQAAAGFVQQLYAQFAAFRQRVAVADAAYGALITDVNIAYTSLTAARVVSLPSAASFPTGVPLTVFDESGACSATLTITLAANGSDTINGAASAAISSAFGYIQIESNGTNKWTVVDSAISSANIVAALGFTPQTALGFTPYNATNPTGFGFTGFRNRFINGDMRVAQRGASGLSSGVSSAIYTLDRWLAYATGAAVAIAQVTGPTGFQYALQMTGAAGNTSAQIAQRIESANIADLVGQTVTIQANIAVSSAQTIAWYLAYPTAKDNWSGQTGVASGTWSATATATTFTASIVGLPAGVANGLELVVQPMNGGAFTSGTFTLTGVQLEPGAIATPFERRPIGVELALCQRYFQKFGGNLLYENFGGVTVQSSTTLILEINWLVPFRTNPSSITFSAASSFAIYGIGGGGTISALTYGQLGVNSGLINLTGSGYTAGQASLLQANNTLSAYIMILAEL